LLGSTSGALTAPLREFLCENGAPRPHPLLYTKAFVAHALAVMRTVPCERLLLMDIVGGGGGYRELGAFLRVTPPNEPFPDLKPPPTTDRVRVFDVL
jgi:hypothetical protein